MTLARIRHPYLRLGLVSIDKRRCAASSGTASSVALFASNVWWGVPTASSSVGGYARRGRGAISLL